MASHLTSQERDVLAEMLAAGRTKADIIRTLARPRCTIDRELKRNSIGGHYHAAQAQRLAEQRQHLARVQRRKMNRVELREFVREGLGQEWSPDEISGRLHVVFPENSRLRISHQTIYTWIHKDHGRSYRSCLRRGGKFRKRASRVAKKDGCRFDQRPAVINERGRYGDWEGDLIVSAGHSRTALITLVERLTGYTEVMLIPTRCAPQVRQAIVRRMKQLPPDLRLSLTFDNGSEFSDWEQLTASLQTEVFFTHPHAPWERGTNENTNGLIRQYFPKGTRFDAVSRYEVRQVQEKLNDRPRKRLGYHTPREVLQKQCCRAFQT